MKMERVQQSRLEISSDVAGNETRFKTPVNSRKLKRQSDKGVTIQLLPPNTDSKASEHTCSNCPVTFAINAPEAKSVFVAGSFNTWDPNTTALSRGTNGEWTTYLTLKPGQYEYRFIVDGLWKEDPAATESLPNPYGERNSVIVVS